MLEQKDISKGRLSNHGLMGSLSRFSRTTIGKLALVILGLTSAVGCDNKPVEPEKASIELDQRNEANSEVELFIERIFHSIPPHRPYEESRSIPYLVLANTIRTEPDYFEVLKELLNEEKIFSSRQLFPSVPLN